MKSEFEGRLEEYELKRMISKCLYEIKMKTSSIGFCYWINSIAYCISKELEEGQDVLSISEVYAYIAEKYATTISCVEKAMRYAKEKSEYKHIWQIPDNLKNCDFLRICVDRIFSSLFHK